ncbi:MAG: protein kinase [Chloroflexi bacterium]|nr:protein kinase [Chloroflexota bacterium]
MVSMPHSEPLDIDDASPPFDQLTSIQRLTTARSGHRSVEHVRHHLYVGRDKRTHANLLIKLASKPGLVYQQNLTNEIASLATINRELPTSGYFPVVVDHGRLRDGRVYMTSYLFDEFPLATSIAAERIPARTVAHLRTTIKVAAALAELHRLMIFHVDLNPMNILYRMQKGRPVIRIVDFESSYERARHSTGVFYNPSTTPQFSAPEVAHQAPDARSDLFSLGAVLYTMLAGYQWTWNAEAGASIQADREIDTELKEILLPAVDPNPDRRYQSVQEFQDLVADYLERIWPGRSW